MSELPQITSVEFMLPIAPDVVLAFSNNPIISEDRAHVTDKLTRELLDHDRGWSKTRREFVELWGLKETKLTHFNTGFAVGFKILSMHALWLNPRCSVPKVTPATASAYIGQLEATEADEDDFFAETDELLAQYTDPQFHEVLESYAEKANGGLSIISGKEIKLGGLALYQLISYHLGAKDFAKQFAI